MATIITVSNQKGGVGKTTTSAALATGLCLAGRKVLGVDLDPQGNLGFCLGLEAANHHTVLDALKGLACGRLSARRITVTSLPLTLH